jgi:hypothetical protein
LTYAELRGRQADSGPVAAGLLLYLNELAPTWDDLAHLRREIATGEADVQPEPGSADEAEVNRTRGAKGSWPSLSQEFRLQRAIKVVPVTPSTMNNAAKQFDGFARQIEESRKREAVTGSILASWVNYSTDDSTCVACDFKGTCPQPAGP